MIERSTPGSGSYGKHMTPEEVIDFFAPHENSADAVLKWLSQSGISADRVAVSVNKQVRFWVSFCLPTSTVKTPR
jgi:tripeptidyl-peptidase-1